MVATSRATTWLLSPAWRFFAVRALVALFPALTAAYPIKKWSAAAALVAAAFYLLLSGAEVATQRGYRERAEGDGAAVDSAQAAENC